jgi:ADP-heptose:LPS heptosyltransferase
VSEIVVVASDGHYGDAVMSLPAICALAEKYDDVYLAMRNREVLAIADLPSNVIDILNSEPQWRNLTFDVLWLAAGAACNYDVGQAPAMSLIHRFMLRADVPTDLSVLPQPKVKIPEDDGPAYEVILAPWTTARERTMTIEQATELYVKLLHLAHHSVLVVGGKDDPELTSAGSRMYGAPLARVGARMKKAKVVITVDSFPSRLAHAVGVKNHIILDSTVTPQTCQGYPGATFVTGRMEHGQALWNVSEIASVVKWILT